MIETRERWLTLKQATAQLEEEYGFLTSWRYLEKLVSQGAPSALNFGKRQVRMSELIPWLQEKRIIER